MTFPSLIEALKADSLQSLPLFAPELALCVTIVVLLLGRLFGLDRFIAPYWTALTGTLVGFGIAFAHFWQLRGLEVGASTTPLFTGLLVYDELTAFFRLFLLLFAVLVVALTVLSGIPDNEDGPDFYVLLLGATVGMMVMASANNLLMLFLGIEMTSVPSYVMVGFLKGRRQSSEASLKYVVYGAGAAGVMLYGTSLLGGLLGTLQMPELAVRIGALLGSGDLSVADPVTMTVLLGVTMVLVGIAFKLSIVPFHFWCPDAFEGSAAEVAGFLSVASKGAAFALLVRFCLAFTGAPTDDLGQVYQYVGIGLGVVAAVTATFGNLAAYAQTNVKRLLAYSTIAHAGYMLMAVAALVVLLNPDGGLGAADPVQANRAVEGLLYYLSVYLFMNLGAFAIVALIRNEIYSEEIEDYNGLAKQCPALCIGMATCMFSLVGMPPLGGFMGKFMIFASLYEAGQIHWAMWAILVAGGLNTVFSLFYYVRVLRAMFLTPRPEGARSAFVRSHALPSVYVALVSIPVVLLGTVMVGPMSATANSVAKGLLSSIFN